jgi:hypothetical protein
MSLSQNPLSNGKKQAILSAQKVFKEPEKFDPPQQDQQMSSIEPKIGKDQQQPRYRKQTEVMVFKPTVSIFI